MGAGILPTSYHNNKIYFLFGKENKYEETAPGWSDFGGGQDNNEAPLETAIREGTEELTGFLGDVNDVKKMVLKHNTFNIEYVFENNNIYRTHIFPIKYDEKLPYYYNNNQLFLQKKLDPKIIQKTKIFEKEKIRWIPMNDLLKMRKEFRWYYREIIDQIIKNKKEIIKFITKTLKHNNTKTKKTKKKSV
jgi:hypothetical protein